MSGCLPMLIQIPIFFGLYRAIVELSNSGTQYWSDNFLWIESLADPDPYKILPILAGVFQFVQTRMMRPANQGKITDPQQAMMNQMMNFMPLMVVIFGWNFASGPVIYWVTQSVFSVIQQWFITGWGSMKDWFPNLPEMPEHRRLGYRPPRPAEEVVVVSGEGAAVRQTGFMGWMQRKMEQQQDQANARRQRLSGGTTSTTKSTSALQEQVDAEVRSTTTTRPSKRSASRSGNRRRSRPTANNGTVAQTSDATADAAAPTTDPVEKANGVARPPVVPRKSRPTRKQPNSEAGDG
jgi:YidC/Oxa1 family membrane protein insertase